MQVFNGRSTDLLPKGLKATTAVEWISRWSLTAAKWALPVEGVSSTTSMQICGNGLHAGAIYSLKYIKNQESETKEYIYSAESVESMGGKIMLRFDVALKNEDGSRGFQLLDQNPKLTLHVDFEDKPGDYCSVDTTFLMPLDTSQTACYTCCYCGFDPYKAIAKAMAKFYCSELSKALSADMLSGQLQTIISQPNSSAQTQGYMQVAPVAYQGTPQPLAIQSAYAQPATSQPQQVQNQQPQTMHPGQQQVYYQYQQPPAVHPRPQQTQIVQPLATQPVQQSVHYNVQPLPQAVLPAYS